MTNDDYKNYVNSSCSYIYISPSQSFVWKGKNATEKNFEVAMKDVALFEKEENIKIEVRKQEEGKELFEGKTIFDMDYTKVEPAAYKIILEKGVIRSQRYHQFTLTALYNTSIMCLENGIYMFMQPVKKDALMPYIKFVKEWKKKSEDKYFGKEFPKITIFHSLKHIPKEVVSAVHGFQLKTVKGAQIESDEKEKIDFDELCEILDKKYTYNELLNRPIYLEKTKLEVCLFLLV